LQIFVNAEIRSLGNLTNGIKEMFSAKSMSQSLTDFMINEINTQKNGEERSNSSDVVVFLDFAELPVMQDDIKKHERKRVPNIRILTQYETFFTRQMSISPAMVRAIEARVDELEDCAIDDEYDKDWAAVQFVTPKKN